MKLTALLAMLVAVLPGSAALAETGDETIRIGILHSLSGTTAISETVLTDTMLMLIEQQDAKHGVLGRKLERAMVDPLRDLRWNWRELRCHGPHPSPCPMRGPRRLN